MCERRGMVRNIADLRAATDEELIAEHDRLAANTGVGTAYYTEELRHRDTERSLKASQRLALIGIVLACLNALVAVVAVVIALTA